MRPNFNVLSQYIGAGNQKVYSFGFKIIDKSQLQIVHADDSFNVVFSTRGDDNILIPNVVFDEFGGTIELVNNLPVGHQLLIIFADDEPVQPQKFANAQSFKLKQLENGLDRITGPLQKLFHWYENKTVRISDEYLGPFSTGGGLKPVAGGVIGFSANGQALKTYEPSEFTGPLGPQGFSGEMEIGDVTEIDYDDPTPMSVENVGTSTNAILDFVLRKGPQGDRGESTVLITTTNTLPDDGVGGDGDLWILLNDTLMEHGNVYQKDTGVYVLKGNIKGPAGGVDMFNGRQGLVAPVIGDYDANIVAYDPTTSGLAATQVQDAIDELKENADVFEAAVEMALDDIISVLPGGTTGQFLKKSSNADGALVWDFPSVNASQVPYSNVTSGLTATQTQAAIDEVVDITDGLQTQINNIATPPLSTLTVYNSGSGTYNVPANCARLKIKIWAGGAGGNGGGTTQPAGGAGGNSTFGSSLLTCNGGSPGAGGAGGNGGAYTIAGVAYGFGVNGGRGACGGANSAAVPYAAGGVGAAGPYGGQGGGGLAGAGIGAVANSGAGGGGGSGNNAASHVGGGGGGAGGFIEAIIDSPGATYAYAVGAGGTAGGTGASGFAGSVGGAGKIIIEEIY